MELDNLYNKYKDNEFSRDNLIESIINFAYKQIERNKHIEAGDFILDFIPKVDNIVDQYNKELCSFTHYINRHIKWGLLSFCKSYIKNKENQNAYQYNNTYEYENNLFVSEEPSLYKISNSAKKILNISEGKIEKEVIKKRLEIFTLKNARHLNYEHIKTLAPLIDKTPEWLFQTIRVLEENCESRIKNREYLMIRYNRLFMDITKDQQRLINMENNYEKEILYSKIREKQKRKDDLYKKLYKKRCGPKNEDIAKVLGIPKGTVDSSLFYIKKSLNSLLYEV